MSQAKSEIRIQSSRRSLAISRFVPPIRFEGLAKYVRIARRGRV